MRTRRKNGTTSSPSFDRRLTEIEEEEELKVRISGSVEPSQGGNRGSASALKAAIKALHGGTPGALSSSSEGSTRLQRVATDKRRRINGSSGSNNALRRHVRYLLDLNSDLHLGENGRGPEALLNGQSIDGISAGESLKGWENDRHHFRLVLSPENSKDLDLSIFSQRYLDALSSETGYELEALSVAHYDKKTPHVHMVIRGVDKKGREVVFPKKEYFKGPRFRTLAQEICTDMLGARTSQEIQQAKEKEITALRPTGLDHTLLRIAEGRGMEVTKVAIQGSALVASHALEKRLLKRLAFLSEHNLVEQHGGKFRVDTSVLVGLKALSQKNDITSKFYRYGGEQVRGLVHFGVDEEAPEKLVGRVLRYGIESEIDDQLFLVVENIDGKKYAISYNQRLHSKGQLPRVGSYAVITQKPFVPERNSLTVDVLGWAKAQGGVFRTDTYLKQLQTIGVATEEKEFDVRKVVSELVRSGVFCFSREENNAYTLNGDRYDLALRQARAQSGSDRVRVENLGLLTPSSANCIFRK